MEQERWRVLVQGIVQGVGFRPFVYGLARRWQLGGFVLNNSQGVVIELEGALAALEAFQQALLTELPPLAQIDEVQVTQMDIQGENAFVIVESQRQAERRTLISPDTAICADCLHELFEPLDRRFHYPFINCTNCGPRFTIIQDVPYDRANTTMRGFQMCEQCQREYSDPLDRRFHAQPDACARCGPGVYLQMRPATELVAASGTEIERTAAYLAQGAVMAIKGLGGYHLACDAMNDQAVQQLRIRKQREARPFALMVANMDSARQLCQINDEEAVLLQSHRRPIVLLKKREQQIVAPAVAPGHQTLGLMLPYTPLHYLLLAACQQYFAPELPVILVMTSGNVSDEPIAYRDEDASTRLAAISDGILAHNREIFMRCDDSVLKVTASGPQFLRRSRGYVPEPLMLPWPVLMPILACGAHLKNTFCLAKEKQAFISHHIGDLENLETLLSFREGIEHFKRLFDIEPAVVVHDLHPDYLATRYALELDLPRIGVQHHHAHIASAMIEHALTEPVIGIAADGSGYGTDGAIWGGEILQADLCSFERCFHLAYMPLPGGEQAIKQPWRMAAAYLYAAYGSDFQGLHIPFSQQLPRQTWKTLAQMIERRLNCPATSSLGRLFDAVAALLGIRSQVQYEGQAAIELEQLALTCKDPQQSYPYNISTLTAELEVLPTIQAIVRDIEQHVQPATIARRFHSTIIQLLVDACKEVRKRDSIHKVVLGGGVFQNQLLLEELVTVLDQNAFEIYLNKKVPVNDGGLSLGQLAIAAAQLKKIS
ncbi:carbamoyltransferase HypF [Dictyobacter kobayashii]|uniref:Carbamoyltransferase n=1 Tax=Dictyobacter kobayashii TaxID=2014872 RepID=A0A402ATZ9_9CHLR|nr:carbamoyltransferase HypF [Dictyobacter kobayashii]GCE22557.1 carbamoyltransferase [Dictyobacter kobayashii]